MKTKLLLVLTAVCLFSTFSIIAQTSDLGFSFQGFAIDPDGKAIGSTAITVRFTLSPGTFTEEHTLTTDAFGVFTAIVGNSSAAKKLAFQQLDFTAVNAATPLYYSLKVEVKKTSGGTYTTISNTVMNSVPYARQAANGVPVGTIVAYAGPTTKIPYGWVLCDGATKSGTNAQWKQLFGVIGTAWGGTGTNYKLPKLDGEFLRGASATRVVGSLEANEIQSHAHTATASAVGNHTHGLTTRSAVGGNDIGDIGRGSDSPSNGIIGVVTGLGGAHGHTITVAAAGGTETRPRNYAVFYIIKY